MNLLLKTIKKSTYVATAFLAGICVFLILTIFCLDKTVLSPDFHKYLFEKNDIYAKTTIMLNSSIPDFINALKKNDPENFQNHIYIFNMLKNSITSEMVTKNLDSIREGTFQYFRGDKIFLPDIYLNPQPVNQASITNNPTTEVLSKIDKVSLSAILLYINRSDISDKLFIMKFIYYVINILPWFLFIGIILLSILGLFMFKRGSKISKWFAMLLISCGSSSIIAGIFLLYYGFNVIPKDIYLLMMSIPLEKEVILSYVRGLAVPVSATLIILGVLLLSLTFSIRWLIRRFPNALNYVYLNPENYKFKKQRVIIIAVCIAVGLVLITSTGVKTLSFKNGYDSNNFDLAVSKLKNLNTVVQVIAAEDEALYTIQIKLLNNSTSEPIPDIRINVKGKSILTNKSYDLTSTTDTEGLAKFTLDKGTFQASFLPSHFQSQYKIQAPFFFDLTTPSSKLIEKRLEENTDQDLKNWGIAELELLDSNNMPVPNIKLGINKNVKALGFPDFIYSYTNSEGIAVFKLNSGNFTVHFDDKQYPSHYQKQSPIDITVTTDSVTRYSIRLVDAKIN